MLIRNDKRAKAIKNAGIDIRVFSFFSPKCENLDIDTTSAKLESFSSHLNYFFLKILYFLALPKIN